jgi:mycothione reductase
VDSHFDLCIIGTGSGNSILDERFDDWSVAIVERGTFGGTCLNVGCIPSKMLIYPADIVETARHGARLGVDATIDQVRWRDIRDRTFGRIDPIAAGGRQYRIGLPNVTVFEHDARFTGHKTLQVGPDTITADRFVIAAGARVHVPPLPGLDLVPYDTSDTIMRIDEVPERLVVLGGGFIACEMAHVFEAFGSTVTIVSRGEGLLKAQDPEISRRITERLSERMDVIQFASPKSISLDGDVYLVEIDTPTGLVSVEADRILVATGRVPNGGQLNVEATGVRLDVDGYVVTDDHLSCGVDGIWALGDVRNPQQLKHLANLEARVVQHNLLHADDLRAIDERFVPHAVFTNPQIASVGLTERQAEMHGRPFATAVKDYGGTAYGWAMEDTTSVCKVIADVETRQLIGAHIIGPQASILIQQMVQGMRFGQTVDEMAKDVIYPHPALSEVVENALLDLVKALDRDV